MKKSIYPRVILKIVEPSGKTSIYYAGTNRRFFSKIRNYPKQGCRYSIRVLYKKGLRNEGEYTTKKDAIHALRAFTEKELFDYVEKWNE